MQTETDQTTNNLAHRLLWSAAEVAAVIGVSSRTVRRMDVAATLPQPVMVGRAVKWRAADIRGWVAAGCPGRNEWEAAEANSSKPVCT
jgi:predicted DNA-binding transcriptional regulator AlpA